jgi:hypothetical protein
MIYYNTETDEAKILSEWLELLGSEIYTLVSDGVLVCIGACA